MPGSPRRRCCLLIWASSGLCLAKPAFLVLYLRARCLNGFVVCVWFVLACSLCTCGVRAFRIPFVVLSWCLCVSCRFGCGDVGSFTCCVLSWFVSGSVFSVVCMLQSCVLRRFWLRVFMRTRRVQVARCAGAGVAAATLLLPVPFSAISGPARPGSNLKDCKPKYL